MMRKFRLDVFSKSNCRNLYSNDFTDRSSEDKFILIIFTLNSRKLEYVYKWKLLYKKLLTIICIFLQCLNHFQGEHNQIKASRRRRSVLDFVQIPLENVQNFRKGGSVEKYPDVKILNLKTRIEYSSKSSMTKVHRSKKRCFAICGILKKY